MKRMLWAAAISAAIVMTGCGDNAANEAPAVDATPTDATTEAAAAAGPTVDAAPAARAAPASADAPEFAVIYPGAEPTGPATFAQGPSGPGGILNFTTEASPDEVVAFYRERAEAAGLKSINAMNRGDARGYAAGDTRNRFLNVVASPVEGSPTDVQLSWSSGN